MNKDEKCVFIWRMGEDLWVAKVYLMVGVGLDVVTYFRGVSTLMFFQAFDEVSASLTSVEGCIRTLKAVGLYQVTFCEVVLRIFM